MIDHLVILVNDLDQAAADYEALGFCVQTRADKVPSHGANYRFVVMADGGYLLLTQFLTPETVATHRLGVDLVEGPGFSDYSFCLRNVDATAERLHAAGRALRGPVVVENELEDGSKWGLRLLMAGKGAVGQEVDLTLPFVVSDTHGREFRIPSFKPHPNGALSIKGLKLTSPTPATSKARLAELLDKPLDALGVSIEVIEDCNTPKIGRARGGVYEVLIDGPARGLLDVQATHGARLILG